MDIKGKRLKALWSKVARFKAARLIIVITLVSVFGICASQYPLDRGREAVANEPEAIANEVVAKAAMANEYEGIIRFHVIANSDSDEDRELKFLVRDCVMVKLQKALEGCSDIGKTRKYIEENLDKIQLWASECVRASGYSYEVTARIGVSAIPAKQYEDLYFPAGNYEALTIKIGRGKGQNWWCVVFPPLCLIDSTGREAGELFDEEAGELFGEDAGGKLVLKSKLLEILKRGKQ